MPLIPLFIQNEVDAGDADLLSAFNFCDAGDHILPFSDGSVSDLDQQHLWGLYTGIVVAAPVVPTPEPAPAPAPAIAPWIPFEPVLRVVLGEVRGRIALVGDVRAIVEHLLEVQAAMGVYAHVAGSVEWAGAVSAQIAMEAEVRGVRVRPATEERLIEMEDWLLLGFPWER